MRAVLLLLAMLDTHVGAAEASPERGARMARVDELRLVFLADDVRAPMHGSNGDATLDVGRMRAQRCGRHGCSRTVAQRRFRVRVDGGAVRSRFVRLLAFVQDDGGGQRVRVDGRLLGSTPVLVDAALPVGVAVAHTVEIEVPTTEPQGMFTSTIVWQLEDNL